jgi:hypothetical protein
MNTLKRPCTASEISVGHSYGERLPDLGRILVQLVQGTAMVVGRGTVYLECEVTEGVEDLQTLFKAADEYEVPQVQQASNFPPG